MPTEQPTRMRRALSVNEHLRKAPSAVTRIVRVVRDRNRLKKLKLDARHGDAEVRNR